MNYELAKKLEIAGFPQDIGNGSDFYVGGGEVKKYREFTEPKQSDVKVPSLEELIDACGELIKIDQLVDKSWLAIKKSPVCGGEGKTPSEAVANLWLALNKKQ